MIPGLVAEKETARLSRVLSKQLLQYYKPKAKVLPKIAKLIAANKRFLLTTHIGADADGLGSQVAMYYLLKKMKKDVVILNNENPPAYLRYMLPAGIVKNIEDYEKDTAGLHKLVQDRYVLILDSSELARSEKVGETFIALKCKWATIDHHVLSPQPNYFVDATYGATTELIWDLYHYMKIGISREAAEGLYTGIVADTGNFRYSKTSLRSHLMAGELIGYGIHSDYVYKAIYESSPPDRLILLRRILEKTTIRKKEGYITAEITNVMKEGLDLGDSETDGIVNILLSVSQIHTCAVMIESKEGELKCSLRSIGDRDVSILARKFGGGGHKNASGLKIKLPFEKAKIQLLAALKEYARA